MGFLLGWRLAKGAVCAGMERSNKQKKSCRVMPVRQRGWFLGSRPWRIHAAALHYFDAVRRAGSIRAAARRLNVASSAVNRQVLSLEAEVGMPLFERLPAGLKLTAAGEILAHHVITVMRDAERAESRLDALQGLRAGSVELVTLEGLCHRIVPLAIGALAAHAPRVNVGVDILATEAIPDAVIGGDAHLGLAFEVRPRPELRRLAVARYRLGAVVAASSPLAGRGSVTLNDCRDYPAVLPKRNFANRNQLHPVMFEAGLSDRGHYEAGSIELIKELVLRGLGVAFMTRVGLETELDAGRLVHVPLRRGRGAVFSELGLFARADTALPFAAEVFANDVRDAMAASDEADVPGAG
jgi:DNA-binding transcriptional LysR family regulator